MKVGIYYNRNYINDNLDYISQIKYQFSLRNIDCIVIDDAKQFEIVDIIIVLGGDGTILRIADICARYNIKIVGVNYGHIGFLAECERDNLFELIDAICSAKYKIVERTMLKLCLSDEYFYALNDVVIQRSTSGDSFSNTIALNAEINDIVVANLSSDGVIISTPVGSTAYSLSAGGSILAPDINAFILTPICAHSLNSKPIVFSNDSIVKIKIISNNTNVNLIVDGKFVSSVGVNDNIVISKSEYKLSFISINNYNFYEKLFKKLNYWST